MSERRLHVEQASGAGESAPDRSPTAYNIVGPAWHATIPADQCYFAVIDASALGTPPPSSRLVRSMIDERSPALDEALQRWLPIPVEETQAAFVLLEPRTPRGTAQVLACAVHRSLLERLSDEGVFSAVPSALPAAVSDQFSVSLGVSPSALNLMVGAFEPAELKSIALRRRLVFAAGFVLVSGLLVLGLSRRASHDQRRAGAVAAAAQAVEERAARATGQSRGDPARTHALLAAEVARLQSAIGGPGDQPIDAARVAAEVLAKWPRDRAGMRARLQNVQVVGTGVSLTIVLPADADPEPILAPLRTLEGWQLQPTQRTNSPASPSGKPEARLNLRLVPVVPARPT